MTPSQLSRFLVSSDFSVYYRRVKQLHWDNQAISAYALLAVIDGQLSYTSGLKKGELEANDFLLLGPTATLSVSSKELELLFLTLSSALVIERAAGMKLIVSTSTVTFTADPIRNDRKLNKLTIDLIAELTVERPGKEIVTRALVEQLLVQLLRQHSTARRSDELELSRVGLIDRRIRRSVELMHAQLDQDLSLKDLAAASYLSPFHFARLFKKLTGATPHNYLAAIRAHHAQTLLADTDLSIAQVGAKVGYLSSSHFTKAFRLATGATPREFRKGLVSS
ncbi:MAG TPA: AraC family transcriptional regulator [Pyrinomonadaceae bacterium]|nr:AraC family transcriptional regulator [Pyrinomonadaceae bacterium]